MISGVLTVVRGIWDSSPMRSILANVFCNFAGEIKLDNPPPIAGSIMSIKEELPKESMMSDRIEAETVLNAESQLLYPKKIMICTILSVRK
jgi:hypothetical protein